MSILSERLKEERQKRGWTLQDVADRLHLKNLSTYSNWEYGTREPDSEMIKRLAGLYKVSTDYLLGNDLVKEAQNVYEGKLNMKDFIDTLRKRPASWEGEDLSEEERENLADLVESLIEKKRRR